MVERRGIAYERERRELCLGREMHGGEQIILRLFHDITTDEVVRASPSFAVKIAIGTAGSTIDEIADEIAQFVLPHSDGEAALSHRREAFCNVPDQHSGCRPTGD